MKRKLFIFTLLILIAGLAGFGFYISMQTEREQAPESSFAACASGFGCSTSGCWIGGSGMCNCCDTSIMCGYHADAGACCGVVSPSSDYYRAHCGGEDCGSSHCSNGKQDCGETGTDCGGGGCGSCGNACDGHCSNNTQDCGETGKDCGGGGCGSCADPCQNHCGDGIKNCGEDGTDCGGGCTSCGNPGCTNLDWCGGCISAQRCLDEITCNEWIDDECGGENCAGNGQSYSGQACCPGLTPCSNGRCGTSCGVPDCIGEGSTIPTGRECCAGLVPINGKCVNNGSCSTTYSDCGGDASNACNSNSKAKYVSCSGGTSQFQGCVVSSSCTVSQCKVAGEACGSGAGSCCAGAAACVNGVCDSDAQGPDECKNQGTSCVNGAECCSGNCEGGVCGQYNPSGSCVVTQGGTCPPVSSWGATDSHGIARTAALAHPGVAYMASCVNGVVSAVPASSAGCGCATITAPASGCTSGSCSSCGNPQYICGTGTEPPPTEQYTCWETGCTGVGCSDGTSCVNDRCVDTDCSDDSDCTCDTNPDEYVCWDTGCTGSTCDDGSTCQNGRCVNPSCPTESDCTCSQETLECWDTGCTGSTCDDGSACQNGRCVNPNCPTESDCICGQGTLTCWDTGCTNGTLCDDGSTCQNGRCVNPDCPTASTCVCTPNELYCGDALCNDVGEKCERNSSGASSYSACTQADFTARRAPSGAVVIDCRNISLNVPVTTTSCKYCGDGIVQPGQEECEPAIDDNCNVNCEWEESQCIDLTKSQSSSIRIGAGNLVTFTLQYNIASATNPFPNIGLVVGNNMGRDAYATTQFIVRPAPLTNNPRYNQQTATWTYIFIWEATDPTGSVVTPVVEGTYNVVVFTNASTPGSQILDPSCISSITLEENAPEEPLFVILKDSNVVCLTSGNAVINYEITVTNISNVSGTLDYVRDELDPLIRQLGITPTNINPTGSYSNGVITWAGSSFTPDQSKTYTYTITIPQNLLRNFITVGIYNEAFAQYDTPSTLDNVISFDVRTMIECSIIIPGTAISSDSMKLLLIATGSILCAVAFLRLRMSDVLFGNKKVQFVLNKTYLKSPVVPFEEKVAETYTQKIKKKKE